MSVKLPLATAVALACAIGASAQSTPTPSSSRPSSSPPSSSPDVRDQSTEQHAAVTITGCLVKSGDDFLITNAELTEQGASGTGRNAVGTSGIGTEGSVASSSGPLGAASVVTGSTGDGLSGGTYVVEGDRNELGRQVNRLMQVTGQLETTTTNGQPTSGAASSGAGVTGTGTRTAADAPKLRAESVRMVAASCAPK